MCDGVCVCNMCVMVCCAVPRCHINCLCLSLFACERERGEGREREWSGEGRERGGREKESLTLADCVEVTQDTLS